METTISTKLIEEMWQTLKDIHCLVPQHTNVTQKSQQDTKQ